MKWWVKLTLTLAGIAASLVLFIYPTIAIPIVLCDAQLRATGQSRQVPTWFKAAAARYNSWAIDYEKSQFAASLKQEDIAGTEWPIFGSVFFLVTANDLQQQGLIDAKTGIIRDAIQKAASIVASPITASWVITKWGDQYLDGENVFYRMLLIMGLSSYEELLGDKQYRPLMSSQRTKLAEELTQAQFHLRDDYPDECYPADVLWAVAAIQRAAKLEGTNHNELSKSMLSIFDSTIKAPEGLPAFQADSRLGRILQDSRGCGNSGILLFTTELDPALAKRWYADYESHFWTNNFWIAGFREFPHDSRIHFADVDSGPIIWGLGSVASAIGIGAAKTVGRLDHAVPLTYEAYAASWPTPFGFLIPGLMGRMAAHSWSLGEVALLFSMTRPLPSADIVPFNGRIPASVWLLLLGYFTLGALFLTRELRVLRDLIKYQTTSRPWVAEKQSGKNAHHPA